MLAKYPLVLTLPIWWSKTRLPMCTLLKVFKIIELKVFIVTYSVILRDHIFVEILKLKFSSPELKMKTYDLLMLIILAFTIFLRDTKNYCCWLVLVENFQHLFF